MADERRLIDAGALIAELRKSAEYHESRRLGYYSAIDHIREQPTVDAVEVVRCKDCVHWNHGDCYRLELSRPDDFCSYGEKRCE